MMKTNLYLAECYMKHPVTGSGGWSIKMVWLRALDRADAIKKLAKKFRRFDEIITLTIQHQVVSLGCPASKIGNVGGTL